MSKLSRTVREAVKFFLRSGYTSRGELGRWQGIIRRAAENETHDDYILRVSDKLRSTYEMQIDRAKTLDRHSGLSRLAPNYMESELRSGLDRRILASADLIKLNRTGTINKTIQRFNDWATSTPVQDCVEDGLPPSSKSGVNYDCDHVRKSTSQTDFEACRVMIDQNHKLIANVDSTIAVSNNAITAEQHNHWQQAGYDHRKDYKECDRVVCLIHGNWIQKSGYVKIGLPGHLDEITQPGEEVFCHYYVTYPYNLRSTPEHMLTQKGQKFMVSMKSAQGH